ncbi:hypothetical protein [Chryseobacterium indoltheticum]|uniref:Uncharacterized protein n=1 Tax=Chryseobacterium indoltheticum TaxID=254 RepID=A0A381FPI4_9FLAO|nr:hypothetical protein [Chryseobacterium indoltheticum]SUX48480.1 Uncharacterised protein [Chryseobacterium indoltheticum]
MLNALNVIAIEGKFKRSEIILKNTFLFKQKPTDISFDLDNDEYCILYYIDSTESWFLTNKNLIFPFVRLSVDLSSLVKVDFSNIKENPSHKLINKRLDLFMENKKINIMVEEKSWHLIYNIFKFIISKNF